MVRLVCFLLCLSFLLPGSVAGAAERALLKPLDLAPAQGLAQTETVRSLRATAVSEGKVAVIVGLAVPFAPEGRLGSAEAGLQRMEISAAANRLASRLATVIKRAPNRFRTYETLPFAAMEVTPAELDRLARDPDVVSITENLKFRPLLATSVPLIKAPEAWAAGFKGKGQTIAIIDTGVEKTHPFLAGKVLAEACFVTGGGCPGDVASSSAPGSAMPCTGDLCDHGTHVAGIAAGSGMGTSGVAPGANLIAIRIFGTLPYAYASDAIAAFEHVYKLRKNYSIAAVNVSLGDVGSTASSCDGKVPALDAAIASLRSAGIPTIAASGTVLFGVTYVYTPACISGVVSVGSVHASATASAYCPTVSAQADKVACYSSSGAFLSLLAPGSTITSSVPNSKLAAMEGTSMAAAHVAGAWAVLKEKLPLASVDQVLTMLRDSGKPVTDYRNGITKPRIDVAAALAKINENMMSVEVTFAGPGGGRVFFSPSGWASVCTASCTGQFMKDMTVTLNASADLGSKFTGWSGACSGTGPCVLQLSAAKSVSATFAVEAQSTIKYTRAGALGTVAFSSPAGVSYCPYDCTVPFPTNSKVDVTAEPGPGAIFTGWSGACTGKNATCSVTLTTSVFLTATFATVPMVAVTYTKAGAGAGSVSFTVDGKVESCISSCTKSFAAGAAVKLQATPSTTSRFTGWSGACTGKNDTCSLTLRTPAFLTANFETVPTAAVTYTKAGAGAGSVSFTVDGKTESCASSCAKVFPAGAVVKLQATANSGSGFTGWSGACKGKKETCSLALKSPAALTATFDTVPTAAVAYTKGGTGAGSVSFIVKGMTESCESSCTKTFALGTVVKLLATASTGSGFTGWSGGCKGKKESCSLKLKSPAALTATFDTIPTADLAYTKAGNGAGSVSFTLKGKKESCDSSCTKTFAKGAVVKLLAAATPGSRFTGWSGACKGTAKSCTVKMVDAASVTARFDQP